MGLENSGDWLRPGVAIDVQLAMLGDGPDLVEARVRVVLATLEEVDVAHERQQEEAEA